jgi:ubiquitin-conjugating enzyme E2 variant
MEWTAIAATAALWSCLAARLARSGASGDLRWPLLIGATAGYLAGDFLSGIVHWFCDTFFEEDTPLIGRVLIHPFREHHRDPLAMTRHGFAEIAGNSCLGLLAPLLVVVALPAPTAASPVALAAYAGLLVLVVVLVATNQLHKWAHAPTVAPLVTWLQRAGLILEPTRHAEHHRTQAVAYCVATGWMNAPLDRFGFFPGAERVLTVLGLPMSRTAPRWGLSSPRRRGAERRAC